MEEMHRVVDKNRLGKPLVTGGRCRGKGHGEA